MSLHPFPWPCYQHTWLQKLSAVASCEPLSLGFQRACSEMQYGESKSPDLGNSEASNGKEQCVSPHPSKVWPKRRSRGWKSSLAMRGSFSTDYRLTGQSLAPLRWHWIGKHFIFNYFDDHCGLLHPVLLSHRIPRLVNMTDCQVSLSLHRRKRSLVSHAGRGGASFVVECLIIRSLWGAWWPRVWRTGVEKQGSGISLGAWHSSLCGSSHRQSCRFSW